MRHEKQATANLHEIQAQVGEWSRKNFGDQSSLLPLLGVMEELGELCHAILKIEQGIRTDENHEAKARDAIGDLLIYLLDFADRRGIDVEGCLAETWDVVRRRDWKANPENGSLCVASKEHHWFGWPEMICFHCGACDPIKQAILDGVYDPLSAVWISEEEKEKAEAALVCSGPFGGGCPQCNVAKRMEVQDAKQG